MKRCDAGQQADVWRIEVTNWFQGAYRLVISQDKAKAASVRPRDLWNLKSNFAGA